VARILNAEKIRKEFREKKRKIGDRDGDGYPERKRRRQASDMDGRNEEALKIKPGETIAHFNKWVSDDYRCSMPSLSLHAGESRAA
jgi:hypothetical protein